MSNKDDNNWDRYEVHVLETLTRLETKQDDLFDYVRAHMDREDQRMDELTSKINKVETDAKWYAKIGAAIWGIVITGVNVWFNKEL